MGLPADPDRAATTPRYLGNPGASCGFACHTLAWYFSTISAGMRPRSLTLRPCFLALVPLVVGLGLLPLPFGVAVRAKWETSW
jgi:hypothetical protein